MVALIDNLVADFGPNLVKMGQIAQILLVLTIIFGVAIGIYILMKYRQYQCVIKMKNSSKIKKDFAMRVVEDGVTKLKFLFRKTRTPIPLDKYIYDFKRKHIILFEQDALGNLTPAPWLNSEPHVQAIPQDIWFWNLQQQEKIRERYSTKNEFMERYGQILITGMFIAVMFVIFLILLNKIEIVASALQGSVIEAKKFAVQTIT
jgi:hypothetical protein|tara:strand:+ start:1116 stop:1727 length:612 start_codon:yes stop_codon:yes gene_type:complete